MNKQSEYYQILPCVEFYFWVFWDSLLIEVYRHPSNAAALISQTHLVLVAILHNFPHELIYSCMSQLCYAALPSNT
jgi:hypothetical protein